MLLILRKGTTKKRNMQKNFNFSLQKRNIRSLSGTKSTRRMGYTRIEAEAGGAARLAMSEYNSDAIDKVTDARANTARRRVIEREAPAKR